MPYLSVAEIAKKWNVSERSVRNYCAQGRVFGAFLSGKTWNIPDNAKKPDRINQRKEQPNTVLDILQSEKSDQYSGGIYHKTQIELTYNSNHIEGSRLTHDQTRYIFETNTVGIENEVLNVDDVIENLCSCWCHWLNETYGTKVSAEDIPGRTRFLFTASGKSVKSLSTERSVTESGTA